MQQQTTTQPKSHKRGPVTLRFGDLPDEALIEIVFVMDVTDKRKTSVYAGINAGTFPAPEKFGSRCTRWRVGDIRKWLASPNDYFAEVSL